MRNWIVEFTRKVVKEPAVVTERVDVDGDAIINELAQLL